MRDDELIKRPGRGWTPWRRGAGKGAIERVWWQSKELHFPKLNVTVWFDGSDLVGIEHWGYRQEKWTIKEPSADWKPMPEGYREAAEEASRLWNQKIPTCNSYSKRRFC